MVGLFFLLDNLDVFPELTENGWAFVLALISVVFLAAYLTGNRRNWGLLFAVVVPATGALAIWLERADVDGEVIGGLATLLMSVPFWAALLIGRRASWWALIPAGVLTAVGLLTMIAGEAADELIGALVLFVIGAPFFVVYLMNRKQWWALFPAIILTMIGLAILLSGLVSDEVVPFIILTGIALPFFGLFLLRRDNWWALVPAGVLTSVAVAVLVSEVVKAEDSVDGRIIGGIILAGIALTFAFIWSLHKQAKTEWAKYPAIVLAIIAVLVAGLGFRPELAWALGLIVLGVVVLLRALRPASGG